MATTMNFRSLLVIFLTLTLIGIMRCGVPSTCKKPGMVVLSFDQGPGPSTGKVLDILSRRNIPAIFHVSVELFRNATWRGYVQRAAYEGHSIGIFLSDFGGSSENISEKEAGEYDSLIHQKLAKASNWIVSATGRPSRHVRFGLKVIPQDVRRIAEAMGLQITRPRIEIRDESNKMDVIWNSVNRAFNGTDPSYHSFIIRMRDIMPNMVNTLDKVIDYIEAKGFRIVPIELCQPHPEKMIHFKSANSMSIHGASVGKTATNIANSTFKRHHVIFALAICCIVGIFLSK